jgi:hypothetical protein
MDDYLNPWTPPQPTPEVESENQPQWSGLYDHTGRKLIRERNPVGFVIPRKHERPRG